MRPIPRSKYTSTKGTPVKLAKRKEWYSCDRRDRFLVVSIGRLTFTSEPGVSKKAYCLNEQYSSTLTSFIGSVLNAGCGKEMPDWEMRVSTTMQTRLE